MVGLGNPGAAYAETRHNAGFWLLSTLAVQKGAVFRPSSRFLSEVADYEVGGQRCQLVKPTTYMNRSGLAVAAIARFYRYAPEQILVVYDEIDLPPGVVRLKHRGGHGGHRGLRDIIENLGSDGFFRLRLGVGHPGRSDEVTAYVLRRAPKEEQILIEQAIGRALALFPEILAGEYQRVMNNLHRKSDVPKASEGEDPAAKATRLTEEDP